MRIVKTADLKIGDTFRCADDVAEWGEGAALFLRTSNDRRAADGDIGVMALEKGKSFTVDREEDTWVRGDLGYVEIVGYVLVVDE